MRPTLRRNRGGQSALFDGFFFFIVMMVASVLVLVASTTGSQERRVAAGKDFVILAHEYRDAFFSSTIPQANYADAAGTTVTLYNRSVLDLMLEEISLIEDGLPRSNFDGEGGVNEAVLALGHRLIAQQRVRFSVFTTFGNHALELYSEGIESRNQIPFDRTTSGVAASMEFMGKQGEATVELWLWT